jgi:hypothetical protein
MVMLKAAKVASWVYVFWNGENSTTGQAWIGHMAWDLDSSRWLYGPTKKIEMSIEDGQIASLDFAVGEEFESSSSST